VDASSTAPKKYDAGPPDTGDGLMAVPSQPESGGWTIDGAEVLLDSLPGVISARIVTRPGGEIVEIHLLTSFEVSPKQTVRNVESALLAHFDLEVDHRKISVAQTSWKPPQGDGDADAEVVTHAAESSRPPQLRALAMESVPAAEAAGSRILFMAHQAQSQRSHLLTMSVEVEWLGERFTGEASGTDLPRTRLEVVANATLRAIEFALAADENAPPGVSLSLDGVKVVEAFDRRYVLTAVNALTGRDITPLAGAAEVDDSADRAVILATLQATDRWVRGRL
jgi:hypothetical protein